MDYRSDFTTAQETDKDNQQYRVKRYYESSAADYFFFWTNKEDLSLHFGYYDEKAKNHKAALPRMNEVMAELTSIKSSDRVLDAGCGYGDNCVWLAQNIGNDVVGLNIVPFQIKMAEEKVRRHGMEGKVQFKLESYTNTSFDDNSFDVVWGLESIVHAEDKRDVIKEASRVLNEGGRMVISEYMLREKPPTSQKEKDLLQPWLKGWAMPSLLESQQYEKLFLEEGFTSVEVHDITKNVKPSLRRLYVICLLMLPISKAVLWMGLVSRDRYNNIRASYYQCKTLWKNIWKFKIVVAHK